jgi:hypothetical protein
MKTITMGDFYVWYCDWCDSTNMTPWSGTSGGHVSCGCCHKEFSYAETGH